ncbi:hypothetical protein KPA99_35310, partial [Burkholderia cenocepacia]|nr:hypothetical protein [Burkholderia cenocepacia]
MKRTLPGLAISALVLGAALFAFSPRPLPVNASTLERHPDIVSRFLARVTDVEGWAREHEHEVLGYLGRETGSGHDWMRLAYGADVHRRLRTDLDEAS